MKKVGEVGLILGGKVGIADIGTFCLRFEGDELYGVRTGDIYLTSYRLEKYMYLQTEGTLGAR